MSTHPDHVTSGLSLEADFVDNGRGVCVPRHQAHTGAPPSFDYSDGEEIEQYLQRVLSTTHDRSVQSAALQGAIRDFATRYHLSNQRGNLLTLFDLNAKHRVLEIGCGCGAISRYLGEQGCQVDAVEGSLIRAELAALRCQDLDNITVYHANANELDLTASRYDVVTFIGVLEYAGRFAESAQSHREAVCDWLRRARSALNDTGVIVIAIENRTGLKYLHGAGEDHFAMPWVGVYDYALPPTEQDVDLGQHMRTYTRSEWLALLGETGFTHSEFCLPFPDYKLPHLVVTEGVAGDREQLNGLMELLRSVDQGQGRFSVQDEPMVWRGLSEAGALVDFANSFLIVASPDPNAYDSLRHADFCVGASAHRRPQYRALTYKPKGRQVVEKRALMRVDDDESAAVAFSPGASRYLRGESMQQRWTRLLRLGGGWAAFADAVADYATYLRGTFDEMQAPEALIDSLPGNLIDVDGRWQRIDCEWVSRIPISVEFILFRGVFYFLNNERAVLQHHLPTTALPGEGRLVDILAALFDHCGSTLHDALGSYIDCEERIQRQVHIDYVAGDVRRTLYGRLASAPVGARLYWSSAGEDTTDNNSILLGLDDSDACQTLTFLLPPGLRALRYLKFDPSDIPSIFHLYKLTLTGENASGERVQLWTAESGRDIADRCHLENLEYGGGDIVGGNSRDVFVATDAENFVLISLEGVFEPNSSSSDTAAAPHEVTGRLRLTVDMTCPRQRDYVALRDHYITEASTLGRFLEQTRDENERLKAESKELALIKASRVWRAAETVRVLVYKRLFKYVPWLQSLSLNVSRRGLRTVAKELLRGRVDQATQTPKEPLSRQLPAQKQRDLAFQRFIDGERRQRQDQQAVHEQIGAMDIKPKISIVMPVYNVEPKWLEQAIDSVRKQSYEFWELCIVDDCSTSAATRECLNWISHPRIKIKMLTDNVNISAATNTAIAMASGDYIGFLDHDDVLSPDALMEVASAINTCDPDVIYSDEDFIDTNNARSTPHFKPDFSPELLLSHNYITHFCVVRRPLIDAVGGFRSEYDGAQDFDFLLRVTERTRAIHHIPKILYHWRMIEQSTSLNVDAKPAALERTRAALEDTLARRGIEGEICNANLPFFFRTKFAIKTNHGVMPRVSVIVPFKDKPELLESSIAKMAAVSTYPNLEFIGISNNSQLRETFDRMRSLSAGDERIRFSEFNAPFNFSQLANRGVALASGEYVVLCNNDVEIINWDWVEAMLEHAQRDGVGVVGGKLYYPNDSVQHAGVVVGIGGYAGHPHKKFASKRAGYFNRANVVQNVSAVTGAFMMVAKSVYEDVGGFDEERFAIACNDVDFCLRVIESGKRNVFTPYAEAYHLESVSRGYEDSAEKKARFAEEKARFQSRHNGILAAGDPFYNPNLGLDSENFSIRTQPS